MTKKSELSLMWQMKREAERDFNRFIKYVEGLEKENKLLKAELFEIKRNTSYNWVRDELEITSNFEKRWDITLMRMKEAELREKYIEHLKQEKAELKAENKELKKKLDILYHRV